MTAGAVAYSSLVTLALAACAPTGWPREDEGENERASYMQVEPTHPPGPPFLATCLTARGRRPPRTKEGKPRTSDARNITTSRISELMADALLQHTIDEGTKAIDGFAPSAMRLAEHLVKNPPKSLGEVAKEMAPLVRVLPFYRAPCR